MPAYSHKIVLWKLLLFRKLIKSKTWNRHGKFYKGEELELGKFIKRELQVVAKPWDWEWAWYGGDGKRWIWLKWDWVNWVETN